MTYDEGVAAERERVRSFIETARSVLNGATMAGMDVQVCLSVLKEIDQLIVTEAPPVPAHDRLRAMLGGFMVGGRQ